MVFNNEHKSYHKMGWSDPMSAFEWCSLKDTQKHKAGFREKNWAMHFPRLVLLDGLNVSGNKIASNN
jgi:hypothetical protein